MAYIPYVDLDYYGTIYGGSDIPANAQIKSLRQASRHIDSLTYNRIVGRGFSNLTEFQRDIIQEVICLQADFEYNNQEYIDNILSSYGINGVSMTFGDNWNIEIQNGVCMKKDTYALLGQTGLTCGLLR